MAQQYKIGLLILKVTVTVRAGVAQQYKIGLLILKVTVTVRAHIIKIGLFL